MSTLILRKNFRHTRNSFKVCQGTKRQRYFTQYAIASFTAVVWVLVAGEFYFYRTNLLHLYGFSIFPLFAWASGLFGSFILFTHINHFFRKKAFVWKLLAYSAYYITILIILETIGYYLFGIQLVTNYPGLPLCNCLHGPLWFQIVYLTMGPVYFSVCMFFDSKKPAGKPSSR